MQQAVDMLFSNPQLFWSITLSILSAVLVVVSVVVSVLTLHQNSRMIEESTRPYIGVSSLQVNNGSPVFALTVKNYGASMGRIVSFECDYNLADFMLGSEPLPLLQGIEGTTLMPGQKIVCAIDYHKMGEAGVDELTFKVAYSNGRKSYTDTSIVGVSMNANIVQLRTNGKNPLNNISYALQTITERID